MKLYNKDTIDRFIDVCLKEYSQNLRAELNKSIQENYDITYIHIDIDFINNTIDTDIKRSKSYAH